MSTDQNRHDEVVDKVLAALRGAAPPDGMEERLIQHLHRQASAPAAMRGPIHLPASSTLAGAWWRGASAGAAAAMLGFGLLFLAGHLHHGHANHTQTASRERATAPYAALVSTNSANSPSSAARQTPCTGAAALRGHTAPFSPVGQRLLAEIHTESAAPSHPAPEAPLTAQERELARLAQIANPIELTSANPENQARLQEQEAAEFDKFFNPPPPPTNNE